MNTHSTTAEDVARLAQVSQATVSRVLNNSSAVRSNTRRRVLRAIRELGYHPNGVARSMVLGRTFTLGLVLADIINPFYGETARAIMDEATRHHYRVIVCNTDNHTSIQRAYIAELLSQRVDGVIFASVSRFDRDVERLLDRGFPCVMYNRRLAADRGHHVVLDNFAGAAAATEFLIQRGHRRIGFIAGPSEFSTAYDRLRGHLACLRRHGIRADRRLIRQGMFDRQQAIEAAESLLRSRKPPTAIFAANDIMALGVLECVLAHRLRVPEDISVIGFDDISVASHARISLTTVSQNRYEMGKLAVRCLMSILEGKVQPRQWQRIVLKPELIVRDTVGPPRAGRKDHQ